MLSRKHQCSCFGAQDTWWLDLSEKQESTVDRSLFLLLLSVLYIHLGYNASQIREFRLWVPDPGPRLQTHKSLLGSLLIGRCVSRVWCRTHHPALPRPAKPAFSSYSLFLVMSMWPCQHSSQPSGVSSPVHHPSGYSEPSGTYHKTLLSPPFMANLDLAFHSLLMNSPPVPHPRHLAATQPFLHTVSQK